MPIAPVNKLKKTEIVWLSNHRCRHSHTYLEHYQCYLSENPERGRTGYLDIEASQLNASFGFMITYCIKDSKSDKIYGRKITKKELVGKNKDKKLVEDCIEDMKRFDRIVTYYGTRFDIPFIRTRALHNNIDFPLYGTLIHNDLYYIVRNKFKIGRNSLDAACKSLLGYSTKTHLEPDYWINATTGDQKSLNYIFEHNKQDVLLTEALHDKIIGFRKRSDLST